MKSSQSLKTVAAFLLGLSVAIPVISTASGESKDESPQVFELRTYTTADGKLPYLHKRFRDHTMRIFEKHGMKNVVYTTPVDGENTLVYVIAHKSRDAAKKSWASFVKDPEWQKVYKASHEEAGGRIVTKVDSQFLEPTDYSPAK